MTTAEAIAAAIEAREASTAAWLAANDEACAAYIAYVKSKDGMIGGWYNLECRERLTAANKNWKRASRAMKKADKLCEFLGIAE
jgi:hypothetical protein